MARVKGGIVNRRRHKKILKLAKGFRGGRGKRFIHANEAVLHALYHAYRHRREKKRDFRRLWIARINAACREEGLSYSSFMGALSKLGIALNRKILADMAISNPEGFRALVEKAKAVLASTG
ncbi:50S ribosomal protein L20 [bacterium]|nr:50S ribosomal protein L20 [bacterium]